MSKPPFLQPISYGTAGEQRQQRADNALAWHEHRESMARYDEWHPPATPKPAEPKPVLSDAEKERQFARRLRYYGWLRTHWPKPGEPDITFEEIERTRPELLD